MCYVCVYIPKYFGRCYWGGDKKETRIHRVCAYSNATLLWLAVTRWERVLEAVELVNSRMNEIVRWAARLRIFEYERNRYQKYNFLTGWLKCVRMCISKRSPCSWEYVQVSLAGVAKLEWWFNNIQDNRMVSLQQHLDDCQPGFILYLENWQELVRTRMSLGRGTYVGSAAKCCGFCQ